MEAHEKRGDDPPPIQKIRTKEPQAPFGSDEPEPTVVSDATADEPGPGETKEPGPAGYAGRDPEKDMPAIPSAPETQGDPPEHSGQPKTPNEPPASN